MSCDQTLDKLSGKLNSRLLVQEENGFEKECTMCPPGRRSKKKPGLDRVKYGLLEGSTFLFQYTYTKGIRLESSRLGELKYELSVG